MCILKVSSAVAGPTAVLCLLWCQGSGTPPCAAPVCRCLGAASGFGLKLGKERVDLLEELWRALLLALELGVETDHVRAKRLHHVKARCRRQPRGWLCALQLAHLHRERRD